MATTGVRRGKDNRRTAAIAMGLFATGVAVSALLIAAHDRPFTGEISVGPACPFRLRQPRGRYGRDWGAPERGLTPRI